MKILLGGLHQEVNSFAPGRTTIAEYKRKQCYFGQEMLDYAVEYPEPEILCRALMSQALNRGARDNVTVVVIKR